MNYTASHIATIIQANALQFHQDAAIEYLLLDSRKIVFPETSVFFALTGPKRSGTAYIKVLYLKGVRNFVVDHSVSLIDITTFPEANFLQVPDVLKALQELVSFHREKFNYPVIGITGSNGKTIVKEWLSQLLGNDYHIVRSPKSYNSQIGVPLSVWQMNDTHTLGIFEAGISQNDEMQHLQPIIRPTIGVISFIGEAHAQGFSSRQQKIDEKLLLFSEAAQLIYCEDDLQLHAAVLAFKKTVNHTVKLFSWSRHQETVLTISSVEKKDGGSFIYGKYDGKEFNYFIPFSDDASVYNAITCCAVLFSMGIAKGTVINGMRELTPLEMRLALKTGINQCSLINDSYSADINSLVIALDFLSQQQQHEKKTVILSDLLESGIAPDVLYARISNLLQQKNVFRFIGIGPALYVQQSKFDLLPQKIFFTSTEEFLHHFHQLQFTAETILLKGARSFLFERIGKLLEQKLHETVLEINLNALRKNLSTYKHALHKNVKMMAMVKAFSYGSGSFEIANFLQHEGIDYLAVAFSDEGVELRKAGIRLPIMVMNVSVAGFDNLIKYNLEPELYAFNILESFSLYLQQKSISNYPIHLKLDTGMHRLGFVNSDMQKLCGLLQSHHGFRIQSVFSHLVASENEAQDSFTLQQATSFLLMTNLIKKAVGYDFIKHLSNSAAVYRHPSLQLDMVRLGIGLYGIDDRVLLQNVTTLKTTISQIKKIKKGESVGYNRKGVVVRDSTIATVGIGYADGYPRNLGNGIGSMLLNGTLVPVIGNVCMDMTMLDITDVYAQEADDVIVFGEELPVKELAQWANTIPYEILTGISQRVKRVYYEE